jgi:hypothetical protein
MKSEAKKFLLTRKTATRAAAMAASISSRQWSLGAIC